MDTRIYSEKAYELILAGMTECSTIEAQCMLLDAVVCQCALFTRVLGGEQMFLDLLERLKLIGLDMADAEMPLTHH
ncbi:hypothetical protein L1F06_013125 [Ectopseudomonas hydrolytica]|uniref:Uncharacterized protein n=1 Tax=Ectopseudomonas hydrolytica TaxID=2493633 RepID=A0ABY5A1Y9_9GAMM|nr:hypothetical protein [Pseudomonas hydrolytica]OCX15316.1 hypothetical protein BBI09_16190 [Stutzerimonas xanthomarina]USR37638.1 hypothetical protein L1F06_013125 [Pseudomonas hydrolytica]